MTRVMHLCFVTCFVLFVGDAAVIQAGDGNPNVDFIQIGTRSWRWDFSYQVSLKVKGEDKSGNTEDHVCGGSLISSRWVLTAAHCFNKKVESVTVRFGNIYLNEGGKVILLQPSAITVHPKYDHKTKNFDVALINLGEDLLSDGLDINAISMTEEEPFTDTMIKISGWGATSEDGPYTNTLMFVELPVVNRDDCKTVYKYFNKNMMCAGFADQPKGYCKGDGGGPAVANGELVAIISDGGLGCGRLNTPGLYTSVASLRPWIKKVSGI